jgi:hypothetical protein
MRCDQPTGLPCASSPALAVVVVGAVHVVLDVFFARPDDLDRTAHLLRDLHGTHDSVVFEATAEAATEQMVVDAYLLRLQGAEFRHGPLCSAGNLSSHPDVATVLRHVHRAVHRLHGRVREQGLLVHCADLLRGLRDSRLRRHGVPRRPAFPPLQRAVRRGRPSRASRSARRPTAGWRLPDPV